VFLSIDVLRHDADHIYITVITIRLKLVTTKNLQTKPYLFKLERFVSSRMNTLSNPLIDNRSQLQNYLLFNLHAWFCIIIMSIELLLYSKLIFLLESSLILFVTYLFKRSLELYEILVWGQIKWIHWYKSLFKTLLKSYKFVQNW